MLECPLDHYNNIIITVVISLYSYIAQTAEAKDEVKDKDKAPRKNKNEGSDSPELKKAKDGGSGDGSHTKITEKSAEISEAVSKAKAKFNELLLVVDNEVRKGLNVLPAILLRMQIHFADLLIPHSTI